MVFPYGTSDKDDWGWSTTQMETYYGRFYGNHSMLVCLMFI